MVGSKYGVFREKLYHIWWNWCSQFYYPLGMTDLLTAMPQFPQGHEHARELAH